MKCCPKKFDYSDSHKYENFLAFRAFPQHSGSVSHIQQACSEMTVNSYEDTEEEKTMRGCTVRGLNGRNGSSTLKQIFFRNSRYCTVNPIILKYHTFSPHLISLPSYSHLFWVLTRISILVVYRILCTTTSNNPSIICALSRCCHTLLPLDSTRHLSVTPRV